MPIIKCKTENGLRKAKEYLNPDYIRVPYLYTNLYKYGIGNANVEMWIDIMNDQIQGIYLRYFTSLHFYTKDSNYSEYPFLKFVEQHNPEVIMIEDTFGERIRHFLKSYLLSREYTIRYDLDNSEYSGFVGYAGRKDIKEIAELLMSDHIYQEMYTKEALYIQLLERFDEGYGKCCIIRKNGKIVASFSINGENDKFIFLGGLIVHPRYRHMGLGGIVLKHLCKYAQDKGVECLSFVARDNVASLELHKKINALPVGMIYKFRKL